MKFLSGLWLFVGGLLFSDFAQARTATLAVPITGGGTYLVTYICRGNRGEIQNSGAIPPGGGPAALAGAATVCAEPGGASASPRPAPSTFPSGTAAPTLSPAGISATLPAVVVGGEPGMVKRVLTSSEPIDGAQKVNAFYRCSAGPGGSRGVLTNPHTNGRWAQAQLYFANGVCEALRCNKQGHYLGWRYANGIQAPHEKATPPECAPTVVPVTGAGTAMIPADFIQNSQHCVPTTPGNEAVEFSQGYREGVALRHQQHLGRIGGPHCSGPNVGGGSTPPVRPDGTPNATPTATPVNVGAGGGG